MRLSFTPFPPCHPSPPTSSFVPRPSAHFSCPSLQTLPGVRVMSAQTYSILGATEPSSLLPNRRALLARVASDPTSLLLSFLKIYLCICPGLMGRCFSNIRGWIHILDQCQEVLKRSTSAASMPIQGSPEVEFSSVFSTQDRWCKAYTTHTSPTAGRVVWA